MPLLPVKQTTATISWPQAPGPDGFVRDITAPLVSGAPQTLDVSIPCRTIATLPAAGGLVFSTIPPAGIQATRNGLFVTANADAVVVAFRDSVAAVAPRAAVTGIRRADLQHPARLGQCRGRRRRLRRHTRRHRHAGRGEEASGRRGVHRPASRPPAGAVGAHRRRHPVHHDADGTEARCDGAWRHLCTGVDRGAGGARRPEPSRPRRLAALLARRPFHVAGRHRRRRHPAAMASHRCDLVRRRLQPDHRPGIATTPGMRPTTTASSAPPRRRSTGTSRCSRTWRRSARPGCGCGCPPRLAAIATWLIISRCVMPRLGSRLANNRVAVWTAGAVFLAAWLPFNNGLRPEPLIAFGALAAWMLVENAIATRRLWPAAVAIVVAVFSVTLAPQGLIALAPLLVGARAVARIIRSRRAADGLVAPLAPLASSLCADLRGRVPRPDAGHRRRIGPHQVQGRPDHPLVSGLPALLLPDRRGQRRLLADPALRRARAAALPVRHARGAAAAGKCPRHGEGPGLAVDRRNGCRAAAADVHADEMGGAVRRVRRPRGRVGRRHRHLPSPGSGCTAAETWRCM